MSGYPILVPDGPDRGLPWHYGDPFGEQSRMAQGFGAVALTQPGRLGVVNGPSHWLTVTGGDGQRFGHLLTINLDPATIGATVTAVWKGYLQQLPLGLAPLEICPSPVGQGQLLIFTATQEVDAWTASQPVGLWAYEALRIAARWPRLDIDIDIDEATDYMANINKLRLIHLDGSADEPMPPVGTPLDWRGRMVGRLGSSIQHFELGPIGLALVDSYVPIGASVLIGQTDALVT